MKCSYVSLLICSIFMLLCIFPINGCLTDWDDKSLHNRQSADYNKVPYEYSSQQRQIVASEKSELKFMTFNQRSGFIDGCVNNVTAQALVIREVDYVGTQETVQNVDTRCNRCNIPQIIANVAGMATRFGMAIPWRTGQYGIMAGTSQRIIETKYLSIPYTGFETRTAVAVKTQPAALQGRFLWFIDVHIEYYSIAVRQFQMSEILKWINADIIAKDSKAVIVMAGDFNGGPWQYEYGTLKEAGYKNSWEVFYGSILEGNTIPADWPGVRFDHIWYRAPTGVTINVKHAQVLNVRLSDHRPYVATLSFTVEGSVNPTVAPTVAPTVKPTVAPTVAPPTAAPTTRPTTTPTTPPTTAPRNVTVCQGPIWENNLVTIKCPELNQRITSYQFASYGTPEGTCGNFKHGNCYGGSSPYVVKDKCVGYNSCVFPIANNVFGDPCPGTGKNFRVQVTCSS